MVGGSGTAAGHGGEDRAGGGLGLNTAMEDPHHPRTALLACQQRWPHPVTEGRGLVVTHADQDVGSDLPGDLMVKTVKT